MKFLRRLEKPTQSYQIPERSRSMTNMARRVSIQVAEVAVVGLTSDLTSSREDEEEDLASSRPTTFSDNSSAEEIHLLISLTTMILSQLLVAMAVRRNNQTNREEDVSKPLEQWVVASSTMMMTSLVEDLGAASEAGQCSNRCIRLVVGDINKCSSQALVEWEWAAAWANLCQHKPTSRMASVSPALKQAQSMLKAIDQLKLKKRPMMVVVT